MHGAKTALFLGMTALFLLLFQLASIAMESRFGCEISDNLIPDPVTVDWKMKSWAALFVDARYFVHGDMSRDEQGKAPSPAYRGCSGITFTY
jgi:hypothetical protein